MITFSCMSAIVLVLFLSLAAAGLKCIGLMGQEDDTPGGGNAIFIWCLSGTCLLAAIAIEQDAIASSWYRLLFTATALGAYLFLFFGPMQKLLDRRIERAAERFEEKARKRS